MAAPDPKLPLGPAEISARWDVDLPERLEAMGSHRNLVVRAGGYVIRVEERPVDSVDWEHELVLFLSPQVPEVVAPLQARDGSTYVVADGRVVSVRAYVEAAAADRASPTVRAQAPRLLARVHRAAAAWPAVRPRPDGSIDRRIADEVVAAYVDAGGHDESYALEPLIRQFLLTTCLHSLTRAATGASWNAGFVAMIERALERLA